MPFKAYARPYWLFRTYLTLPKYTFPIVLTMVQWERSSLVLKERGYPSSTCTFFVHEFIACFSYGIGFHASHVALCPLDSTLEEACDPSVFLDAGWLDKIMGSDKIDRVRSDGAKETRLDQIGDVARIRATRECVHACWQGIDPGGKQAETSVHVETGWVSCMKWMFGELLRTDSKPGRGSVGPGWQLDQRDCFMRPCVSSLEMPSTNGPRDKK